MKMSGRPMEGYVFIDPPPRDERTLPDWLELGVAFVNTLPPKPPRSTPRRSKTEYSKGLVHIVLVTQPV